MITQSVMQHDSYPEIRDALDTRWACFFKRISAIPIPLPSCTNIVSFLDAISPDGILLSGGNSLASLEDSQVNILRDRVDRIVIEYALKRDLPILGICRGMQSILAYFGSSFTRVAEHVTESHAISKVGSSRFIPDARRERRVNSYHAYGSQNCPAPLKVLYRSKDGCIEAAEHYSKPMAGIMWHPERLARPGKLDIQLFKNIFQFEE